MNTTGSIIRKLRLQNELTLEELANNLNLEYGCNLTKGMISKWESDKSEPRFEYAKYLSEYFNISLDYLISGKEKEVDSIALNKKDQKDIRNVINQTLEQLQNNQSGLMFDGEPIDEETKELLRISLENSMRLAKQIAKSKFTPKKYKK